MKNTIGFRAYCVALGIAACMAAPVASATVHRVFPGGSIQAAIDGAAPGDTILVEPGTYLGTDPKYGLRIAKDNLRLIGKVNRGRGEAGKVRVLFAAGSDQKTGVYAAPAGCDYNVAPTASSASNATADDCRASTSAASRSRDSRSTASRPAGWMASSSSRTSRSATSTTASTRRSRRTAWCATTSPTARSTPRCGWPPPRTCASSATSSSAA